MEIILNRLTPEQFLALYRSVGWEPPGKAQVEIALQNSLAVLTACENGRPVGMLRILGDGGMSFYLKDFAVLPAFQAQGVGSLLLCRAEEYIRSLLSPGWAVSLELISTKEAVPFYKKHGFEESPCDGNAPGILKMLR